MSVCVAGPSDFKEKKMLCLFIEQIDRLQYALMVLLYSHFESVFLLNIDLAED